MHQNNLRNEGFIIQNRLDGLLRPALLVSLGLHLSLWFGANFFQPAAPKAAIPVWIEMAAEEGGGGGGLAPPAMAAITEQHPGSRSQRNQVARRSRNSAPERLNRGEATPVHRAAPDLIEPAQNLTRPPESRLAVTSSELTTSVEPVSDSGAPIAPIDSDSLLTTGAALVDSPPLTGAGRENGSGTAGQSGGSGAGIGSGVGNGIGSGIGNGIGTGVGSGSGDGRVQLPYSYFQRILTRIESMKRYPRFAKERGLEGKVRLEFVICGDGRIKDLKVVGTSGSRILDQDAIATLRRAGPFPPVPGRSAAETVAVRLAITYQLIAELEKS